MLDADVLLLMRPGMPRDSLKRRLARRVGRVRASGRARRLGPHLRTGVWAAALVDPGCLDASTQRAVERDRRAVAVGVLGEDLSWPEAGGLFDDTLADRVVGVLRRRLVKAREAWVEEESRRVAEGYLVADPRTGKVVLARGLGEELYGNAKAPGRGRKGCLSLLARLVDELPLPEEAMGELVVEHSPGRDRITWRATLTGGRGLRPRALCLNLSDQTLALNWLERQGEARWLDHVASVAEQLAHDFNNVLQAIVSNLDLLRLELRGSDARRDALFEPLERAARSGVGLTTRILALTRSGEERRGPTELSDVLEEMVRLTRADEEAEIPLRLRGARRGIMVRADRPHLADALAGLVRGAFVGARGVTVDVVVRSGSEVQGWVLDEDQTYVLLDIRGDRERSERCTKQAESHVGAELPGASVLARAVAHRVIRRLEGGLEPGPRGGARVLLPLCEGCHAAPAPPDSD